MTGLFHALQAAISFRTVYNMVTMKLAEKGEIRNRIKSILAGLSKEDIASKSLRIARSVEELESFQAANVVMLYLPIPGEVDVLPLAKEAWANGKIVVSPTACDHCHSMRTVICRPENEEMFHSGYGLRQPDRGLGELSPAEIDLVVVPALAFDPQCNRLGRGGGFYDRFLARDEVRAKTLGVAFAEQILPGVPIQPEDHPVDWVVTDTQTYTKES